MTLSHRLSLLVAIFLLAAPSANADEVSRLSARSAAKGKITKSSRTELTLKPKTGADVKIPVNDVVSLKFDDEPPGLSLARGSEKKGNLTKARDGYLKAKQAYKGPNGQLKAELDFLIARVSARQAMANPDGVQNAIDLLERFRTGNGNNIRFFESTSLLAELYVAKNDSEKARSISTELSSAPVPSLKMKAAIITGRSWLAANDVNKALAAFDSVAGMAGNSPADKARANEAELGKATCLQRQQKFNDAIKAINVVIDQSAGDSAVLAEAYLRQGDCFRDQSKTRDAIYNYLHVDLLFSGQKSQHAEALYNLSQLWTSDGHPDRATDARARLSREYPNSVWAKK